MDKLLVLLKQQELWMRFKAIQLLKIMAINCPKLLGSTLLAVKAGMMRLIDVLDDTREEVRNELLLLLQQLTVANSQASRSAKF